MVLDDIKKIYRDIENRSDSKTHAFSDKTCDDAHCTEDHEPIHLPWQSRHGIHNHKIQQAE